MGKDPWTAAMSVARRQDGALGRRQALVAGLTRRQLEGRVRSGQLTVAAPNAYVLNGSPDTPRRRILVAKLSCDPGAVVSHRSAAFLWRILDEPGPAPEIAVPASRGLTVPEVVVYRTSLTGRPYHVPLGGIAVTSPALTLIDLAGTIEEALAEEALDAALRLGRTDLDRLRDFLARPRIRTRRGSALLRGFVALRTAGRGFETTFETMVFRILRGASLPLPVVQYWIQTAHGLRRIDMAYPDVKVALEPEGFAGHASRRQFDTDRVKRTDLDEMGWTVVQVTYTVALLRPLEIAISVGNALGLQPARWRNANPRRRRRPRDR